MSDGPVKALRQLLTTGEAVASELSGISSARAFGLWFEAQGRAVATVDAMGLVSELPSVEEAMGAVLGCQPDIRAGWRRVTGARLKELGERKEPSSLIEAVTALGEAAGAVGAALEEAGLMPTGNGELERATLGAPAEQAVAFPALLRVLSATAPLVEGGRGRPAPVLEPVTRLDPSVDWVKGRLLRTPTEQADPPKPRDQRWVLSGSWSRAGYEDAMAWVLASPWIYLLAQLVFLQEAWAAERRTGGLWLELESELLTSYLQPPRVQVVVELGDGQEVPCGTLGELLARALGKLGVGLVGWWSGQGSLDASLAPIVGELQSARVWQFRAGTGGRRPGYIIDPAFSDECYRVRGSRYIYRLGTQVTGALRAASEDWARDRALRARARDREG